jgi:hypothetical protein
MSSVYNCRMKPAFRYKCRTCEEWHYDIPIFAYDYPSHYLSIPDNERDERTEVTADTCVIDGEAFYVVARLLIPVAGIDDDFGYTVWVSLSEKSFGTYLALYDKEQGRESHPPVFAWVTDVPAIYPRENLKAMLHFQPYPSRPQLELEPTDHPLGVEQRDGITVERLTWIVEQMMGRPQTE